MSDSRGFTLVEVVISLALVSLVMLGLVGAMRTFGDSASRMESRSSAIDDLRIVPGFLEQILSRASPRARQSSDAGAPFGWFEAYPQEMAWLGIMPGRHGAGGLSHFRLGLTEQSGSAVLALQLAPFRGDGDAPDWTRVEPEVVADQVVELAFRYLSADGGEWLETWGGDEALPGWVSISIKTRNAVWPTMIFRLLEARAGRQ